MPTERANGAMPLNWDVLNQVTIHLSDSKADLCNFMRTCRTMHSLGMRSLVARYTPHLDIDDSIVGSLRPPQYDVSPDSTSSAWRSTLGFLQMLLQDAPARALLLEVFEFPHTSADKALERRFSTLLSQVLRYSANLNAITLAFGHLLDPQVPPALVSGCVRLQSITLLGETCSDSYAAAVAMFQSARWPLRAISINTATPSPHPILESFATSITELSLAFLDSELGLPRFPSVRTLRLEHPSLIDGVALSAAFPNLAELFVQSDYSHDDDISGNIDGWHYENEDHDAQWSQLDFVQGKTPYVYALAATRHIRRLALDVFIESQTDGDRLQAVLSAAQPVVLSLDIQLDVWNSSAYLGGMWDGLASTSRLKCLALSFYVHEPDMVQHVDFRVSTMLNASARQCTMLITARSPFRSSHDKN